MGLNDKNIKSLFLTSASSIILLLAFAFSSCTPNKPEEIKALTNREVIPSLKVKDLTTVITDSGKVKYRFVTPELLKFDQKSEPTIEFPSGLHLFIFNDIEEVEAQIKCKNAIYHQNEELWELRHDVEAVNVKGEVINTELLFWDGKKRLIYSNQFIKITRQDRISTGYGFESDEQLVNFKIKNFSGEFEVEEPEE
jgi:LPS export ABC transporter protein LptC